MNFDDLEVFVEAVRIGSLAGAARRLGMSPMAASRSLGNLETELGARLIHRTTRSLSPTGDGEIFLPHARALLEGRANALTDLRPDGRGLTGHLRITASAAFGRKIVAPMLPTFMSKHPGLQVDLLTTDEQVDIVAQGIDVAIRIAPLRDNRLVAKRLADNPKVLCGSSAYLAANGHPHRLADLAAHECLQATGGTHWAFVRDGRLVRQKVSGRFSASSIEAVFEACRGGLGIANLSGWYVDPAIDREEVVKVTLEDAEPEPLDIWAVYPSSHMIPLKVRLFVAELELRLKGSCTA